MFLNYTVAENNRKHLNNRCAERVETFPRILGTAAKGASTKYEDMTVNSHVTAILNV